MDDHGYMAQEDSRMDASRKSEAQKAKTYGKMTYQKSWKKGAQWRRYFGYISL